MTTIQPGTSAYERLPAHEKYEWTQTLLADEKSKHRPDFSLIAKLEEEGHFQRMEATLRDPEFDMRHNLFLPDKGGRHVLLNPFESQETVVREWIGAFSANTPLRLLIPKSRRHGISQIISALMYRYIRSLPNQMGLVVAHEDPATKEIFSKYRYFHKYDPYAPELERGSVNEVKFLRSGGSIQIRTAGSSRQGIGHGFGFHCVHWCLAEGTKILDPETGGFRYIEDFELGDWVWTHTGQEAQVSTISSKTKDCIELSLWGMPGDPLRCSSEHKLWTVDGWRQAGELGRGDRVGFPVPDLSEPSVLAVPFRAQRITTQGREPRGPEKIQLTYELGRFMGLYVAEGSIKQNPKRPAGVSLACHDREAERNAEWAAAALPWVDPISRKDSSENGSYVDVGCTSTGVFMEQHCGRASGKHFPRWWDRAPSEFVDGLVHGYLAGDGHYGPTNGRGAESWVLSATSVLPAVSYELRRMILGTEGAWASISLVPGGVRGGRVERDQHRVRLCGDAGNRLAAQTWPGEVKERRSKRQPKWEVADGYAWVAIRGVSDLGELRVYDFEVDHEDHSYLTAQCAVSNSEPAFYQSTDPYALISGILTAMPPIQEAWTASVMESTGNGQSGMFYDLCMEAHEDPGSSEWKMIFLPWTDRYDAWRNFCSHHDVKKCNCDQARIAQDKFESSLDDEEKLLAEKHGASLHQLHWRRHTYQNEIKAFSTSERRRKFRQEHPLDLFEAFQASGGSVFDADIISKLLMTSSKPKWTGEIEARTRLWEEANKTRVFDTPAPKIRNEIDGPFSIWHFPTIEDAFCIGVDLAQGAVKGDFHVITVFNRDKRRIDARYRIRGVSPLRMVEKVRLISRFYNNALICPEVNFFPQFTEILADTDREKFLYWRKDPSRTGASGEFQKAYGWRTTNATKRNLVTMLQDKLEAEPGIFTDAQLLREMLIFREKISEGEGREVKYVGAIGGDRSHDDIVIATGLALYCDYDMPRHTVYSPERPRAADWGKPKTVGQRMEDHMNWRAAIERDEAADSMYEDFD